MKQSGGLDVFLYTTHKRLLLSEINICVCLKIVNSKF